MSDTLPPASLVDLPFWGVWRREPDPETGELRKIPYNPQTRRRGRANDHTTFGTRAQADRTLATGSYVGLCILVDEPLGITGGDLDHVVPDEHAFDESKIPPAVWRVIRIANTWTCWSPSGTGIRFIFGTSLGRRYMTKNKAARICIAEAYSRLRFMTIELDRRITGTPDTFNAEADDLEAWHETLGFPLRGSDEPVIPRPAYAGGSHASEDVIAAAERVNGGKFQRLMAGNIDGYPESQSDPGRSSEADAALVSILCGYTVDDAQVANIWRRSGLTRKKLDRDDYVTRTIASARARQTWWYDWERTTESTFTPGGTPTQHHAGYVTTGPNDGETCPAQLMAAKRRIRELEAELVAQDDTIATLRERIRWGDERDAIQRNTKLGAARQTGAALADLFRVERPRSPAKRPDKVPDSTPYRIPLATLANRTGQSADTCSKHVRKLAEYRTPEGLPVLHVETVDVPRGVNQETGEIIEPHRELWIGPGVEPSAFGHVLAALSPANAPKHGGKQDRNVCPDHPLAGTIRRTKTTRRITHECAECNTVLSVNDIEVGHTEEFIRAADPIQHHAFEHRFEPTTPERPTRQDAASSSGHTVTRDLPGKMRDSTPLRLVYSDDIPQSAGDDYWTRAGAGGAP